MLADASLQLSQHDFDRISFLQNFYFRRYKRMGTIFTVTCGHPISKPSLALVDQSTHIYLDEETACPLCKRPSNLQMPIFRKDVFEALNTIQPKFAQIVANLNLHHFIDFLKSAISLDTDKLDPLYFSSSTYSEDAIKVFQEERGYVNDTSSKYFTNFLMYLDNFKSVFEKSPNRNPEYDVLAAKSISGNLKYIELFGLANCVKEYSLVLHNLYLLMRQFALTNQMEREIQKNSPDQKGVPEPGSKHLQGNLSTRILSKLLKCNENNANFIYLDLEKAYSMLIAESVSSSLISKINLFSNELVFQKFFNLVNELFACARYRQLLKRFELPEDTTFENVKELPQGKRIIGGLLKLLRMCAFMKYVVNLPNYQGSKSCKLTSREEHV